MPGVAQSAMLWIAAHVTWLLFQSPACRSIHQAFKIVTNANAIWIAVCPIKPIFAILRGPFYILALRGLNGGHKFSPFDRKMAPATWTTDEQSTFLKEWLVVYLNHTEDKDYYRFWPAFFSTWFMQWPEKSEAFLDIQDPLTAEQESELGKLIELQKNVS